MEQIIIKIIIKIIIGDLIIIKRKNFNSNILQLILQQYVIIIEIFFDNISSTEIINKQNSFYRNNNNIKLKEVYFKIQILYHYS